jgi:hypothetical protein
MSENEIVSLLLIGLVVAMAYMGSDRFKNRALQIEENKKKTTDEEYEELRFVNEAYLMLPDDEAAIRKLMQRFTWQQICECLGAGVLEMELLRSAGNGAHIVVPDPKGELQSDHEKYLVKEAKGVARDWDDETNWAAYFQVPTTLTLGRLSGLDLVEPTLGLDAIDGTHFVSANNKGLRLLELDEKFREGSSRFEVATTFFKSTAARNRVSELVQALVEPDILPIAEIHTN